jgi:hypothetical protein
VGESQLAERTVASFSEKEVAAVLAQAQTVGYWRIAPDEAVVVMMAIGSKGHPLLSVPVAESRNIAEGNWQGDWEPLFRSRPAILKGGVSAVEVNGKVWLLAVGRANRKKNAGKLGAMQELAFADAMRRAVGYVKGIGVESVTRLESHLREVSIDEQIVETSLRELLSNTSREKVSSRMPSLKRVGHWTEGDGTFEYHAFTLNLSDSLESRR